MKDNGRAAILVRNRAFHECYRSVRDAGEAGLSPQGANKDKTLTKYCFTRQPIKQKLTSTKPSAQPHLRCVAVYYSDIEFVAVGSGNKAAGNAILKPAEDVRKFAKDRYKFNVRK